MEQKLTEFRARRRIEQANKSDVSSSSQPQEPTFADMDATIDSSPSKEEQQEDRSSNISQTQMCSDWLLNSAVGRWLLSSHLCISNLTLLKLLLWLVLLGLFAELEFGLPFFVISLFYWLYEGLRSPSAREPGELSAYSVFNPDCQPLLGTLTAEQLEGEMGYRPLAPR
ncbi:SAYSvFN domain-containing protein 1 [Genypterus blacodes]|uniref:SAYSvFN domain-containing protein 1 n=1 Tax=Genypterus blacodes TaxID=154954 RepID=UPI003F769DEF